jgi:hypothetical protein
VGRSDHPVGHREGERLLIEGLGDAESSDEQSRHRREHDDPYGALLGIDHARQPRIAHPRPPQHGEHEHPPGNSFPARLGGHQRCALCEREHEDEVEVELERFDGLALA